MGGGGGGGGTKWPGIGCCMDISTPESKRIFLCFSPVLTSFEEI